MSRILIVEDEPLIAAMLAEWLEELGHEVLGPVTNVGDALTAIDRLNPSGVILDINLHSQRCDPVAEVLAARSVPVAFATGADASSVPACCLGAPTLEKPYDFEMVRNVLAELALR